MELQGSVCCFLPEHAVLGASSLSCFCLGSPHLPAFQLRFPQTFWIFSKYWALNLNSACTALFNFLCVCRAQMLFWGAERHKGRTMVGFVNGTAWSRSSSLPEPEALLTPQLRVPTGTSVSSSCSAPSTVSNSVDRTFREDPQLPASVCCSEDEDEEDPLKRPCRRNPPAAQVKPCSWREGHPLKTTSYQNQKERNVEHHPTAGWGGGGG